MEESNNTHPASTQTSRQTPSPLMFWILAIPACAVFAPCAIVPVLQDYRALVVAEALEQQSIDASRAGIERQRRHLTALRSDPLVAERLAQRDLAYARPGDTQVPLTILPVKQQAQTLSAIPTARAPAPIEELLEWIPFSDRVAVYCDRTSRTVLMCLSAALLIAAFILYPPRRLNQN